MIHLCFPALENCYALTLSYGEICVGCNCCGRIDKANRGLARLRYWQEHLEKQINFNDWCDGELRKVQEENRNLNIKLAKRKIAYYKRYE